jgi:TPR repeat protein
MTSRKIAALLTCGAVICGAAILWPAYKKKTTERKLAVATNVRAERGDANAQYSLGNMYAHGQGLPQDYARGCPLAP